MIERLGRLAGLTGNAAYRGRGLAGAALLTYGAWLIYEPAGFIVCGVILYVDGWTE